MFNYISPEARVPKNHSLRPIWIILDNALVDLAPLFKEIYSHTGSPSIPSEQLLRALLLQILYSIRSERIAGGAIGLQSMFREIIESIHKIARVM